MVRYTAPVLTAVAIVAAVFGERPAAGQRNDVMQIEELLRALGPAAGFAVHLGTSDGRLEAALAASGRTLVQGLAGSEAELLQARRTIEEAGCYGLASVIVCRGRGQLPYRDNLANALVVSDPDTWTRQGIPEAEWLRVVAPQGVVCAWRGGKWTRLVKPRPAQMDQWRRHANASAGTYFSRDTALKAPFELRWVDGPNCGARPACSPSSLLVSDGGKYYALTWLDVTNFGSAPPPEQVREKLHRPVLVARDAFNGLALWRSVAPGWGAEACATEAHLFMPRRQEGAIVAYCGNTGEQTLAIRTAGGLIEDLASDGQFLYVTSRIEKQHSATECFRATTGEACWKADGIGGRLMIAGDNIYLSAKELVAMEKRTGKQRWKWSAAPVPFTLEFATPEAVVVATGEQVTALAATDGARLWSVPLPPPSPADRYRRPGRPAVPWKGGVVIRQQHHDLATGRAIGPAPRIANTNCAPALTTPDLVIRRDAMIVSDPQKPEGTFFGGMRTQCRDAGMIANGLIYTGPTLCSCSSLGRIEGFTAFGAASRPVADEAFEAPRPVIKGGGDKRPFVETPADWPTYRHDYARSGCAPVATPPRLRLRWKQKLWTPPDGPVASSWSSQPARGLTAPTIAGGLVHVADSETHRVLALSAADGRTRWTFRADGRVDAPPTIYRGRCLFGSRDGWVYCLRADDGELVWRARAAPDEQSVIAYGQVESAWPVPGCVAVKDDVVHAGAGRTCHVDGGIAFCGFRLEDGATVWAHKGGLRNDVPVSDGSNFYVQGYRLSADRPRLRDPGQHGRRDLPPWHEDRPKGPVLEGKRLGLLDATITLFPPWLVEYRMQHKHLMGCTYAGIRAWLAVWDSLDAFYYDTDLSQRQTPGAQRLRASKLLASKGQPATSVWSLDLPADVRVDSLLVTSDALVAAGARGVGTEAPEGLVWVYARRDGAEQQEVALPGLPAYQSLAAVPGRLFVSTRDGSLICLEGVSD